MGCQAKKFTCALSNPRAEKTRFSSHLRAVFTFVAQPLAFAAIPMSSITSVKKKRMREWIGLRDCLAWIRFALVCARCALTFGQLDP